MAKQKSKKTTSSRVVKTQGLDWLVVALKVVALVVGTGATIIAAQLFVGNILLALIGAEQLGSPAWSAIYSALSYIVVILILVFLPDRLRKIMKNTAEKKAQDTATTNKARGKDAKIKTASKQRVAQASDREKVWGELGFYGWPTWADIGLAPVGYVAYLVLGSGLLALFTQLFPWFNAEEVQNVGFSLSVVGGERLIALITLVVVAPIVEEVIFRGWLYEKLKRELRGRMPKWAEITIAVLSTSILFGFVHLQWNVGVNVFALSIILCLLREITGTTYAGILLHALKNGVAFYILFGLGM